MARLKRKRISLVGRLRNYFITGIVVLVPIGITLYLTTFFIKISSKLIPKNINPNSYLPFSVPGLGIVLSVIFTSGNLTSSEHKCKRLAAYFTGLGLLSINRAL